MPIVCRLCECLSLHGSCRGARPGPSTNARKPETLQPLLASVEV